MSRASNSLRASDAAVTPIKLKYTSSFGLNTPGGCAFEVLTGINGVVTTTGSIPQETLNYYSARHLFYSNYLTGSFPVSASAADNYLQSTAASGTLDADLRYFPTQSDAQVRILSIPREVFGQQVSKHGFELSSSAYFIVDDGNGNLIDQAANNEYVGNIIYPQGIVLITNQDYVGIFPYPPKAKDDYAAFTTISSPKTFNILSNDTPGTGTILPSSVTLSGGDVALFTNNFDGTVTVNTSVPGSYVTFYTVEAAVTGSCNVKSNLAQIKVDVVEPSTTTTTTTSTTTTTTTPTPTTTTTTSTTTTTTTPTPTTTTSTTTTTTTPTPTTTTTTSTTTTTTTPTPTTTTTTSTTTTTTTQQITVINAGASSRLDLSDYYVDADVTLNLPVPVDSGFTIDATTQFAGTVSVSFTVPSGSSLGNGSTFLGPTNPGSVTSFCISSCDNPNIDISSYSC